MGPWPSRNTSNTTTEDTAGAFDLRRDCACVYRDVFSGDPVLDDVIIDDMADRPTDRVKVDQWLILPATWFKCAPFLASALTARMP